MTESLAILHSWLAKWGSTSHSKKTVPACQSAVLEYLYSEYSYTYLLVTTFGHSGITTNAPAQIQLSDL